MAKQEKAEERNFAFLRFVGSLEARTPTGSTDGFDML